MCVCVCVWSFSLVPRIKPRKDQRSSEKGGDSFLFTRDRRFLRRKRWLA